MKNIYELSTKDKDRYRGEFNKLTFTKDINIVRGPALFITIFTIIASGILQGFVDDGMKLQTWVDLTETVGVIALVVFAILTIYLNIAFTRWMKIKHDIEY